MSDCARARGKLDQEQGLVLSLWLLGVSRRTHHARSMADCVLSLATVRVLRPRELSVPEYH